MRSRDRRQLAEVWVHPDLPCGCAQDQLARIEMFEQFPVQEVRVALDERLKAFRSPALHVHRHEAKPRASDRLVILVLSPVPSRNMPDRADHDALRFLDRVQPQVGPRELEVLSMAKPAAGPNDLLKDLEIGSAHEPTVAATARLRNPAQRCERLPLLTPPRDGRVDRVPSMAPRGEVILRPATAEDIPSIASIWHRGWLDGHIGHVPERLMAARNERSFWFRAARRLPDTTIAELEGAVAGFVMVVDDEVEQVYVGEDHRGSGVAKVLLAEAERRVQQCGYDIAWLAVVAGNERARRFYAKCGWVDEGPFDYQAQGPDGPITVPSHRYVKAVEPH
jgi:ribosomal protein S18 acetylase RimI-like enzyme